MRLIRAKSIRFINLYGLNVTYMILSDDYFTEK